MGKIKGKHSRKKLMLFICKSQFTLGLWMGYDFYRISKVPKVSKLLV